MLEDIFQLPNLTYLYFRGYLGDVTIHHFPSKLKFLNFLGSITVTSTNSTYGERYHGNILSGKDGNHLQYKELHFSKQGLPDSLDTLHLWCGELISELPPKLKKLHVYKYYNSKIPSLPDGLEELRLEDYFHPLPHLPSSLKHLYIVCSHPKPVPIRSFPPGLLTLSVRSSPTDPLRKILPVFPNLPESLQKLELWCEVSEYLYLPPTLRHLVIGKNKYDLPPYPLTLEYLQTYAC